jgi:hypothetical protein
MGLGEPVKKRRGDGRQNQTLKEQATLKYSTKMQYEMINF